MPRDCTPRRPPLTHHVSDCYWCLRGQATNQ
jgi:hypothetical protein